jgi:hypothetical protein
MQCDLPRYWCRIILLRCTPRVLSVRVPRVARGHGTTKRVRRMASSNVDRPAPYRAAVLGDDWIF